MPTGGARSGPADLNSAASFFEFVASRAGLASSGAASALGAAFPALHASFLDSMAADDFEKEVAFMQTVR